MSDVLITLAQIRTAFIQAVALIGSIARATADALEEMAAAKADKAEWRTITVAAASWAANTDAESKAKGFAYMCEAGFEGVTASDSAECVLAYESMDAVKDCGLGGTIDVLDGKIRFYAVQQPAAAITIQVRPIYGVPISKE